MVSSPPISITVGTRHDYLALQRFHYVDNAPATMAQVLRATDGPQLIGVLVISMPTLNAWWRAHAWPGWLPPRRPSARPTEEVAGGPARASTWT